MVDQFKLDEQHGSKFLVSGYALIPVKVAIEVDTIDEHKARDLAMRIWNEATPQKRSSLVVPGTGDETCVNDFIPSYCEVIR